MRFVFSDEQEALKREARRFLDQHATPATVRSAMESERGWAPDLWKRIGELGWPSLAVPEAYGGVELGFVELVAIFEETGRALLCAPFFSTVCLGTAALTLGGSEAQKATWLPELASGAVTATLAHASSQVAARTDGASVILRGTVDTVIDGHTADLLLIPARESAGLGVYLVPKDAAGLQRRVRATLDPTRKLAAITLDGVQVPASARLPGDGALLLARTLERAKIALAAEQVGGAQRCLELSVDYAQTRVQFGRPIGSFQAIKHKCADQLVLVESARSALYWAGFCAATDDPELPIAASLARSYCSEAFFRVAGETIQIHGGIGFTWEHDAHLYFRRARSSMALFDAPAVEREAIARSLGL